MSFVQVNGADIHYEMTGETGPCLVLIHGSGGSAALWPEELLRLPGVRVAALDLPGHGRSGGRPSDRVEDYARVVAGVVESLGLSGVYLLGHSLGGAIALQLALSSPPWLSGVILVGSGARLRVFPAILEGLENDFAGSLDMMDRFLFSPGTDESIIRASRRSAETAGQKAVLADFTACDRFDVMERLGEISVPALVVSADNDALTPAKYGKFMADAIPDARFALLSGTGHMMALEKPKEVAALVSSFLSGG
ncbi:MAG: alpha/beta hydrolase [Deltaproteobacteria bacterium]|nr:alpha/beta hydrolase [Deltaproteobacteria bacterium]